MRRRRKAGPNFGLAGSLRVGYLGRMRRPLSDDTFAVILVALIILAVGAVVGWCAYLGW